jgi:SAM-dependent MidA family methyltransferase
VIEALRERLDRFGSQRFDEYVELALYDPDGGFFASGGGAGRGGADFLTSPEVGPVFGAVVAEYLDRRWVALGRPDPYVVIEAAAGRGALAISVLAASPRCAPALRYVLVERSAELRDRQHEHLALVHPFEVLGPDHDPDMEPTNSARASHAFGQGSGPLVCSLEDLPAQPVTGVVLANELLDNMPFRLLERGPDGWLEVRVVPSPDRADPNSRHLVELLVPADETASRRMDELVPDAPIGARVPFHEHALDWLRRALGVLESGSVLVIDYTSTTTQLAARPSSEWLRTYRGHERGGHHLEAPGSQDITCEVATDQLDLVAVPTRRSTQSAWLAEHGLGELVKEGRRVWQERAAAPDLESMRARSRISEAEALTDPGGLGDFEVLEWDR